MLALKGYVTERSFGICKYSLEGGTLKIIVNEKTIQMEIYFNLQKMKQEGIELYLNGELSTPEEIAQQHCLREESSYMPDYVRNDAGKLLELRYDKVTNQ